MTTVPTTLCRHDADVPDAPGARWLAITHETRYRYERAVDAASHSAHLRPRDADGQRVASWSLAIAPPPGGSVQESTDAFGNWRHGFTHARVHDELRVVSRSRVRLDPRVPADLARSLPWDEVAATLRYRAGRQQPRAVEFGLPSEFVPRDATLRDYGDGLFDPGRPVHDCAHALMRRIHADFAYAPEATDVATDAVQALERRAGVCQDLAHVMVGVLRARGLAASYVSGYLLTHPLPGQPKLVGSDASHAWTAVWCPHAGWLALDPTNDCVVGLDHVTLGWGRDYGDVAPLRGLLVGGGALPQVAVTVEESGPPVPAAAPVPMPMPAPALGAGGTGGSPASTRA